MPYDTYEKWRMKVASQRPVEGRRLFFTDSRIIPFISVLIISLFLNNLHLTAETPNSRTDRYRFSLTYLGMTVAEVVMKDEKTENQGILSVQALSTRAGKLLFPINNRYCINYLGQYLPVSYEKDIEQRGFSLNKIANFNREHGKVVITDSSVQQTIELNSEGRDFFSSLLYLSDIIRTESGNWIEQGSIIVYANNNFWQANYLYEGKQRIRRIDAGKYRITFKRISNNESDRSDVLTNNLIKEDAELFLWYSQDKGELPLRAEFTGSPFSVFWHLETD